MAKKKTTKTASKRPTTYENKVSLKEDVTFSDLLGVAVGKKPKKKEDDKK